MLVLAMVVSLSASAVNGHEEGTGLMYGPGNAFTIKAPPGWTLDTKSGQSQGLYAVFYPVGSSWSSSPAMMYVNTALKSGDPTLEHLIQGDVKRQKAASPNLQVVAGEPIAIGGGKQAPVNHLSGDKWGNIESIAYIEAPTVWVLVVLSSRDRQAYERSLPAFINLVRSHRIVPIPVKKGNRGAAI
jgi:hypothetical protein